MSFDVLAGGVMWDQIAYSILFATIFTKDTLDHPDVPVRYWSNFAALAGCALLAFDAIVQPDGIAVIALAAVLFIGSLLAHLLTRVRPSPSSSSI